MRARVERHWSIAAPDPSLVTDIRRTTGLSSTVATILANRGFPDAAAVDRFLNDSLSDLAPPFAMKDLERASRRLAAAGARREPVLIYADYDADGATGAAILLLFLREAFPGLPVAIHQNNRITEGYGVRAEALARAAERGCRLVVTVDCGISDGAAIAGAGALGMEVIVTDHHLTGGEIPPAFAVLNPRRRDCPYPEKELAGVGVAFALACGIRSVLRASGDLPAGNGPNLRRYLDLVALGTVADMVPLRGDNRRLVRAGIEEIRKGSRPGVRALLAVSGIDPARADETDLGFRVAPRLNAAGRMGDPGRSAALLVATDEAEAFRIARELHLENGRRQREEERILREAESALARERDDGPRGAIVLADPSWHPGVLGIVASRLVDRYGLPAVVLKIDGEDAVGSARSVEGVSIVEALREVSGMLSRYGGHDQAAGVGLPSERIPAFRETLSAVVGGRLAEAAYVPRVRVDAVVRLEEITFGLMGELARIRPFGVGNEEPLLAARSLRVVRRSVFGDTGQHMRLEVDDGGTRREIVAFQRNALPPGGEERVDVLFTPQESVFRGARTLRLMLRDARAPKVFT